MKEKLRLPERYRNDIDRAVRIRKEAGCSRVFIFGSLADSGPGNGSDIDLAVQGCPRGKFFYLMGRLLLELDHPVDLVNLESEDPFARYLEREGRLIQVG